MGPQQNRSSVLIAVTKSLPTRDEGVHSGSFLAEEGGVRLHHLKHVFGAGLAIQSSERTRRGFS